MMEKRVRSRRLGSLLIFLSAGILYAAEYFNLPRLNLVVVLGFGLFACINGLKMLRQEETFESRTGLYDLNKFQQYEGLSANLMGGILVVFGLMIVGLDLLEIFKPGGAGAFLNRLASSPSGLASVIGLAGIFMIVFGVIRILSANASSTRGQNKWMEFKAKAGGAVLVLIGLILILGSIWMALSPGSFLNAIQEVFIIP